MLLEHTYIEESGTIKIPEMNREIKFTMDIVDRTVYLFFTDKELGTAYAGALLNKRISLNGIEHKVILVREHLFKYIPASDRDEILAHEKKHIERGLPSSFKNRPNSLEELGLWYYEEEQAINKEVAPKLYRATEKAWNDPSIYPEFIVGGIHATLHGPHRNHILKLIEEGKKKYPLLETLNTNA